MPLPLVLELLTLSFSVRFLQQYSFCTPSYLIVSKASAFLRLRLLAGLLPVHVSCLFAL